MSGPWEVQEGLSTPLKLKNYMFFFFIGTHMSFF